MKKLKLVLWIIVAVAIFLSLGLYVYYYAMMNSQGNTHPEVTFESENGIISRVCTKHSC